MILHGARHMAIVALQIIPFTNHVYALDLDVDIQGERLRIFWRYFVYPVPSMAGLLIELFPSIRIDPKCWEHRYIQHDEMVHGKWDGQPRFHLKVLVGGRCTVSGVPQLLACH